MKNLMYLIQVLIFSLVFNVSAATPPPPNNFLRSIGATPSNPSAGTYKFYVKSSDGFPYVLNSSGTESTLQADAKTLQTRTVSSSAPSGGDVLTWNATTSQWAPKAASSSSPGGSNTYVQYNNAGSFGGITGAVWNGTSLNLGTTVKLGTGLLTWPNSDGSNTNCLKTNGSGTLSWGACATTSGSPAGNNTEIQFNSSGSFGSSSSLVWDGSHLMVGSGTPGGGLISVRSNALDHIFMQRASGFQAYTLGVNTSANLVLYDYTNGRNIIRSNSGAANDSIVIRDSTTGTIEFNQHLDMKSKNIQAVNVARVADGSASAPSFTFTNNTDSGMYRVGSNTVGLAANGILGLELKKSTGSFVNIGMGVAASTSDQFPVLIQRSQSSAGVHIAVENTSTSANSKGCVQLKADNGANLGDVCVYTASGTIDAITDAMFVRPSGGTAKLSLDGGDEATGTVVVYTGGDRDATGKAATFNANHTTTFHNHPILQIQGAGSTPTCDAARQGAIALTNGLVMCVCNGSGATWKKVSDGTTTCTF